VPTFIQAHRDDIVAGRLCVTWHLWKYAHYKPGNIYQLPFAGGIEVEDVRAVPAKDVTDADARDGMLSDAQELIDVARSHTGAEVSPETLLYRVQFRYIATLPTKPPLSLEELEKRLERMDARSLRGPWTLATLRLIEENPQVVARRLAYELDWETLDFKTHVRKLKALGLTISHPVGYELSELGQAYLDSKAD
jgi:hypothetical protein